MIGYLLAFITSLFFSLYVIPKKIIKEKTIYYTSFLTFGFLITSTIFYTFFVRQGINTEIPSFPIILILIVRGLLWYLSISLYAIAIDKIGISRATQYQNLKTPFCIILTLSFLNEFITTNLVTILCSTILTFTSAILLTIPKMPLQKIDKMGIFYAILSAILLATTNFLQKLVTNEGIIYSQHIFTAISSFLFASLSTLLKDKNLKSLVSISKQHKILAMLGGCLFFFASFFQALAYQKLPASIVSIIVQLSAIWSILFGITIFKEIDLKRHWKRILCGIIITLFSILVLF